MTRSAPFLPVLAGPTASGKSALAMELAALLPVELVNADSMQIYRGMDVGTAKPGREDRERVPHHLLDIRDPGEDYSLGEFVQDAREAVAGIRCRGRLPLVVGGTGLYIRGLLGGIFPGPPRDEALRDALRMEEAEEPGVLYRRLEEVDPETASRTMPGDLVRIVRALEVEALTGCPISRLQREHAFGDRPFRPFLAVLHPPRPLLYRWIEARVDGMMKDGLLEEVRGLLARGFGPGLNAMKALGYREILAHLQGEITLEEAVDLVKRNTRRFAKRQLTWFRGEPEARWLDLRGREGIPALARGLAGTFTRELEGP